MEQDAAANAAKVTVVADALSSNQSKVSVAEDHVKAGESTTVTLIAKECAWQRYQWSFVVGKFDGDRL
ncbi:Ig domain-containing protein [Escherichia coli]|uniref:Ig domain-containing protein n=1 Tax=Escherichia coli TaxID=562 RepID=A0A447Y1V0_ECOLX|nr:Ig domain-containing protein [Escherichia coli]